MSTVKLTQRSFTGGELSPEMLGRSDDTKYASGLALCRNFVPKPQGVVQNRAGFAFAGITPPGAVRLIPFRFSSTQTMVLEFSDNLIRFYTQGAQLMNGAAPFFLTTPYAEADLFDIHYVQSADVVTLVHPNYPPKELKRLSALHWTLKDIDFNPSLAAPGSVTITKTGSGSLDYYYVVTAINADDTVESASSAIVHIKNNVFTTGNKNTISWAAVAGAAKYNLYKKQAGLFGYIGQTTDLTLDDDNIAADLSKTPPRFDGDLQGALNYPTAVSYFEQRRVFAGTKNDPQTIWMTRSATETQLSYSLPVKDDDRIKFRVASREANYIRHVVPLSQLLLMTSSTEWRVTSVNSDAITPSSVSVKPQSYIGASNVQPEIINNTVLFCGDRGGHVYELAYNWQASGFITGDTCLRASHLFDNEQIVDMAYSKAPIPTVWFVSTSGKLLGLTYIPEQSIGAWHQHDTQNGVFLSCCVVAEGNEDVLYCVIRREIAPATYFTTVERMATRQIDNINSMFFVDGGVFRPRISDTPFTYIDGLNHLEGLTVSVLGDGAVQTPQVVSGGRIYLEQPAFNVVAGLPIQADIQTLPIAAQIDNAFGQGRFKNVNKAWLRTFTSSSFWVGPDANNLIESKHRHAEAPGSPPDLKTGEVPVLLSPSWAEGGQVFVRQIDPLPLTIVSLTAEVSLGG